VANQAEYLCSRIGILRDGRITREGTIPELLSSVPAKAIALVETSNPEVALAAKLDWGLRAYAGRIACLIPKQLSLEGVLHSLSGAGVLSISLQRVSLEHAYLEAIHNGQALVGDLPQVSDARARALLGS
jgi:ABC-2 type transport system ATP-binding protein